MTIADDKPQRPSEHFIEPKGITIVHNGVEYRAYTLEEFKEVKHIFVDYHLLFKYSLSLESDIESFKNEIKLWNLRVINWEDETKRQIKYSEQFSNLFDEEHKLRIRIEKSQRFSNWFSWALVAVEAVALSVVGVTYAVKE